MIGPGPAPLPRERALVPYRQRLIYLGSGPGPLGTLIPGAMRVREFCHLWVSDLALRKLRTVED